MVTPCTTQRNESLDSRVRAPARYGGSSNVAAKDQLRDGNCKSYARPKWRTTTRRSRREGAAIAQKSPAQVDIFAPRGAVRGSPFASAESAHACLHLVRTPLEGWPPWIAQRW